MVAVNEAVITEKDLGERISRFDIVHIVQHAVLMINFVRLVDTGLPLQLHNSVVSQWWA